MQNNSTARIEGNVTKDPVLRKTKTGKSVCTFSIAVNHYSKNESEPQVSFIEVETWEKVAEMCASNITKGRRLMVIGSLRQDRWEGEDGKLQSRIKILSNEIKFLESFKNLKADYKSEAAPAAEAV